MTANDAFTIGSRLAAMAHVVACAELLVRDQVLRQDGMMSWPVMKTRAGRYVHPVWEGLLDSIYDYPQVRRLVAVRMLAALAVMFAPGGWVLGPVLLPILAALVLVYEFRCDYGSDGSDQMASIVTVSLAVGALLPKARVIALGFLAFQVCLSYGVAGWAKMSRKEWWNGRFAIGVSKTQTFGSPKIGSFLERHPRLAAVLSSGMLVWEMGFPLVLVLPMPVAVGMLVIGIGFHIFNALHMGLNTFVWAFAATYPAVIYVLGLRGY